MLRDVGVRTKLLAVLAIPTLLLALLTSLLVSQQVAAARRADQVAVLTDVALQVNRVVHSLQEERSATRQQLAEGAPGSDTAASTAAAMKAQRAFTDDELRQLTSLLADSPIDQVPATVRTVLARSTQRHATLPDVRAQIDSGALDSPQVDDDYARIVRTDLELPEALARLTTSDLATRLHAYRSVSAAIETATRERDLVELALVRGVLTQDDLALAAGLRTEQGLALDDVRRSAPPETANALSRRLDGPSTATVEKIRGELTGLISGGDPALGRSAEWAGAAKDRVGAMTATENLLVGDVAELAVATKDAQRQRTMVLISVALVGLGLAAMLAVGLARRITRPLRHLTEAAVGIRDQLPQMVERMQTPGEGPGLVLEPIRVTSRDEVGRLAEAFNAVNDMTVAVARDQAALRAGISEMFVNVARRNQVLLGRQLAALDRMESREEDPEVLTSLYSLDHLATRMRRNAESLLVLAGIDSTRRLRTPMPLSDVLRTAVGEIEAYARIELAMTEDADVSGRHALLVAHLLAELLENATHFSDPGTVVLVGSTLTDEGVELTVTDRGLGMSVQEIAEANERIAHPPVSEIAVSQRLGLYVVGRLAERLGAQVVLRPGVGAGLAVTVSLPASVLDRPRVVAEPPPSRDDVPSHLSEVSELSELSAPRFILDNDSAPPVVVQSPPPSAPAPPSPVAPSPVSTFPVAASPASPPAHPAAASATSPLVQRPLAMPGQPVVAWQPPASDEVATAPLPSRCTSPTRTSGRHRAPADDSATTPDAAAVDPVAADQVAPLPSRAPTLPQVAPLTEAPPLATPASAAPVALARRTPKVPPAAEPTFALAPPAGPRPRSADDVRGMLAGFRSGVARGRDEAAPIATSPDHAAQVATSPDRAAPQHEWPTSSPDQAAPQREPHQPHQPHQPKDETP